MLLFSGGDRRLGLRILRTLRRIRGGTGLLRRCALLSQILTLRGILRLAAGAGCLTRLAGGTGSQLLVTTAVGRFALPRFRRPGVALVGRHVASRAVASRLVRRLTATLLTTTTLVAAALTLRVRLLLAATWRWRLLVARAVRLCRGLGRWRSCLGRRWLAGRRCSLLAVARLATARLAFVAQSGLLVEWTGVRILRRLLTLHDPSDVRLSAPCAPAPLRGSLFSPWPGTSAPVSWSAQHRPRRSGPQQGFDCAAGSPDPSVVFGWDPCASVDDCAVTATAVVLLAIHRPTSPSTPAHARKPRHRAMVRDDFPASGRHPDPPARSRESPCRCPRNRNRAGECHLPAAAPANCPTIGLPLPPEPESC